MKISKPQYRFVVAFDSEAKSIIIFYKLNIFPSIFNGFKIYKNNEGNIWLVITNKGNINAAAGVSYLKMLSPTSKRSIWINIGIAGHLNAEIGTVCNIKKVVNANDEKEAYYTNSVINDETFNLVAHNVDKEEKKFRNRLYVYEMEALGFIKIVEKFCSREMICILKIISDNKKNPLSDHKSIANKVIKQNITKIDDILIKYYELSKEIKDIDDKMLKLIEKKFHLTFFTKNKIKYLMPKIEALKKERYIIKEINSSKTLNELLKKLEKTISANILRLN